MTNSNLSLNLSPSALRKGWQVVKFGEIAREVKSTTKSAIEDGLEFYVGLEHLDPQSLRIQRKGVIAEDSPSFTRRFKAGQILFGKRRCYQKKAAVADFEGICSGDIIVMEAVSGKIIPELLPFIVQSGMFFEWAERTSSGSLSPRTKWKSLAEFEFPLPPLERQKEILEVLEKVEAEGIRLEDVDVVIAGGRGIGGREGFKQLEEVAQILKGAVGATRIPCDNGWLPIEAQIGLTGKIVAPNLYIAVALSGASQHISGCSNSKIIVAINKDPDANIFREAHFGVVGDWKQVLPAFTGKVKELLSG